MKLRRYMLKLSYIGSKYSGSQKTAGVDSIQGALEETFELIEHENVRIFKNKPTLQMAGRTDAGVHALSMTAHIDIVHEIEENFEDTFLQMSNRHLWPKGHCIRILTCHEVNPEFHARHSAKLRTYLFRFMIPKYSLDYQTPLLEQNRSLCLNVPPTSFDMNKLIQGLELFRGTKDFTTFSSRPYRLKDYFAKKEYTRSNIRTLDVRLEESGPLMPIDPLSDYYTYWHLIFTSRSFLYNQIRRIVGSLIALGLSKATENDILTMLEKPSHHNWKSQIKCVPPHGLYLKSIDYDESDTKKVCSKTMSNA